MAMKMPEVSECSVTSCAYNTDENCHALAITVGDDVDDPTCDTFFETDMNGGVQDVIAGVGACKVSECQYNDALECSASSIQVGLREDQVDCLTYEPR
jgi:hypothetical protein